MAFSKSPIADTYSTSRVSLINDLDLRPGSVDATVPMAGIENVVPFKADDGTFYGETRLAIGALTVLASANGVCRGFYVWEKTIGTLYYFVVTTDGTNSKVYTSTDIVNWTAVTTLTNNASTPVRFTEFISSTNTKSLVMVDGFEGYVFTSNAAGTKITDADFPTPHVPFPVFMDGYLFLAKAETGDIYNSDLDDPANWTAGSFLSAEIYPDPITALLKVNNYILAIGTNSGEYFYDAAVALGSPLARYDGATLPFGTSFVNTIAANKDTVMLLANNNDGSLVFKVISGFNHSSVPALGVYRGISQGISSQTMTYLSFRGFFLRHEGQLLYILNTNGNVSTPPSVAASFVYATDAKKWCLFKVGNVSSGYYPVQFSASSTTNSIHNFVAGHYNGAVFCGTTNPNNVDPRDSYGNIVEGIREDLYIPPQDFGTQNRKFLGRVGINYWATETSASDAPTLLWADAPKSPPTSSAVFSGTANFGDGGFPFVTQLGSFRQRQFQVTSTANLRHRWYWLEFDINKGQQ